MTITTTETFELAELAHHVEREAVGGEGTALGRSVEMREGWERACR